MIELLFKLLCGHAMADFVLQSDAIARGKNRHGNPPGYDPKLHGPKQTVWPYFLTAHAFCHGLAVYLATGVVLFGILEVFLHWVIDFGKCEKLYGIHVDQALHIAAKLMYVGIIMAAK